TGKGDEAAFTKSCLIARSPPSAPTPALEKSGCGGDFGKRGRDPASPQSSLRGTLPKRSRVAQEESISESEVEEDQTRSHAESVTRLSMLLDNLYKQVYQKQVRHIKNGMGEMIVEMRRLSSSIEQAAERAEEPVKLGAPENVCCKCAQPILGGRPG
ncbi:hypothetical protein KR054_003412, partial [Drosophila jambulina]